MARRRWPAVRLILLFILILAIAEYGIATVGVQMFEVPVRTDFASYYFAGKLVAADTSPYDAEALAREGYAMGLTYAQYPFLYPPLFAQLMQPLSSLPFMTARAVWMWLSTVCLAVALITTVRVMQLLHRSSTLAVPDVLWWLLVPFIVMVLNSTGLHNDLRHGSVGAMLYMALILMLQAILRGRARLAGLWLALATLLKLVPILLLPWLAWRAGRRAALTTIIALVCSLIPALLEWGPSIFVEYARQALWPASHVEIAWTNNVSVEAFCLRLLAPLAALGHPEAAWTPVTSGVGRLAARITEAMLLLVTFRAIRRAPTQRLSLHLELATLVLLMVLVMRLTWVHTLTTMLFVYPFLMVWGTESAVHQPRAGVRRILLTSLAFFLSAAHLPVLWEDRWMTWPWLLAPGLHTVGLLMLWWLCIRALGDRAQPPGMTMPRVS